MVTLTIQFKGPTENRPYRSAGLVSYGEKFVWDDGEYLYAACFGKCERTDVNTFRCNPEIAWYLSDIEWYKVEPREDVKEEEQEYNIYDLRAPFEGIASPVQLLRNYCSTRGKAWNQRTPNWVKVEESQILNGTSHSGGTSCRNLCRWMGIDPDGHTFDGARKDR